ncbi:hypothetical protein AU255_16310 [Methyloprofundus sedimenti]|uniref:Uncharacterized protein n=1 Tax=Methyloprofundus sedimenti TaxID=1420851 RepID=A0A1V8M2H5_9GAMM|nr:hypothetical protein [Methyloprofundus sedimenti]OQK15759.1 hypothetical protein AU255_16310 [Methyloprofundus sedimenti]
MSSLILINRVKISTLVIILLGFFAMPSFAASFTLNLVRTSTLTNVDDAEGRWQFEGGEVYLGKTLIGYFVSKKRVSFGALLNKAALETTIILSSGDNNITFQGEHSFTTGNQEGAVSAASAGLSGFRNATVSGTSSELTFTY